MPARRNDENKDLPYVPLGVRDEDEVPSTYEDGAIQVFGLGPSRVDLERGKAQQNLGRYQPQPERVVNAIVIAARKLFLEDRKITPANILDEWDYTICAPPNENFVQSYISSKEFETKAATIGLEMQKISKDQRKGGLSAIQHAVISSLTYPDGKPLHLKLKKHRIPWVTFQGWIKDPNFLRYLKLNAEQALDASQAFAMISLVQQAALGTNMKAVDTVLAMTGRWDPNNRKQLDAQKAVSLILQVLDEEIADSELKTRIGARLQILSVDPILMTDTPSSTISGELDI